MRQILIDKVLDLHSLGLTNYEISKTLLISYVQVRRLLRIKSLPYNKKENTTYLQVIKLYLEGKTPVEIREYLGVSMQMVYAYLKDSGKFTPTERPKKKGMMQKRSFSIK